MDTSNPVVPSDRRSISELIELSKKRRRQDLKYLSELTRTAPRNVLPVVHPRLNPEEVQQIVAKYRESLPKVSEIKETSIPSTLEVVSPGYHISGILGSDGFPLHPPSVNCSRGLVCVNRKMGGVSGVPMGMPEIVEILGDSVLDVSYVYTNGTWSGFMNRIQKQSGRKTKSIVSCYREYYQNPKMSEDAVLDILDRVMPRDRSTDKWPRLDGDLDEMLNLIKVTGNSSAGMPYHCNKAECMDDIISVGIPMLVKSIKEGTLNQLWEQNPEFFLSELKNKRDRYEIGKLDEKCRPYLSMPAHIALLQSILVQRFQETLRVFTSDSKSSNAYGFSAAKGGLKKFYKWMISTNRRGKVVAYGDDSRLAVKARDGKIYIVDPDFQQMDGSIDADDVQLVINWIRRHFAREEGGIPPFWEVIFVMWTDYASSPAFLIDGPTVYKKKTPSGLFSGVPGTTLFDTVKSVMMWNMYLDRCERTHEDPLSSENAHDFMKRAGLVIKPGTWNPAPLPEPRDGQLLTDHKFLGVQIRTDDYDGRYVFVPVIPAEDALNMLVVQKDDPFDKDKSPLSRARTLYDRMRGLYMTFGFTNPVIESAIHNVVNNLNPAAIVMSVMSGRGEAPESLILENFTYPDSSGFPTKDFCYKIFSDAEYDEKEGWIQIFPTVMPLLEDFKKQERYVDVVRRTTKIDAFTEMPPDECTRPENLIEKITYEFKPLSRESILEEVRQLLKQNEFQILDLISKKFTSQKLPDPKVNKPNELSKYVDVNGNEPIKRSPALGECVRQYLEDNGIVFVRDVRKRFAISARVLQTISEQFGIFLTGLEPDDTVSLNPIATPTATIQSEVAQHIYDKRNVIGPGTEKRQEAARQIAPPNEPPRKYVQTGPFSVEFDKKFFRSIGEPPKVENAHLALNVFTSSYLQLVPDVATAKFENLPTEVGVSPANGVELKVRLFDKETCTPTNKWVTIARARADSCKMAKLAIVAEIYQFKGMPFLPDKMTSLRSDIKQVKQIRQNAQDVYTDYSQQHYGGIQVTPPVKPPPQLSWADDSRAHEGAVRRRLFVEPATLNPREVLAPPIQHLGKKLNSELTRSDGYNIKDSLAAELEEIPLEHIRPPSQDRFYFFSPPIEDMILKMSANSDSKHRMLTEFAAFMMSQVYHRPAPLRDAVLLRLLTGRGSHYVASLTQNPSKRQKMKPERKQALNRKLYEKRKMRKNQNSFSPN